jgi:hypothetical protein
MSASPASGPDLRADYSANLQVRALFRCNADNGSYDKVATGCALGHEPYPTGMATESRPLLVRVIEFRDSLRSQADQIEEILKHVDPAAAADAGLDASVKIFRIVADDLDKLVDGQELAPWMITGVMPD